MRRTIHGARTKGGSVAKLTNNTLIFGIMGGLAPMRNIKASTHVGYRVGDARMHQDIPLDPKRGLVYMMGQNPMGKYMLSRNPQCAGGIGRMASTSSSGAYTTPTRGKKVFIPPVAPKGLGALSDDTCDTLDCPLSFNGYARCVCDATNHAFCVPRPFAHGFHSDTYYCQQHCNGGYDTCSTTCEACPSPGS